MVKELKDFKQSSRQQKSEILPSTVLNTKRNTSNDRHSPWASEALPTYTMLTLQRVDTQAIRMRYIINKMECPSPKASMAPQIRVPVKLNAESFYQNNSHIQNSNPYMYLRDAFNFYARADRRDCSFFPTQISGVVQDNVPVKISSFTRSED